MVELEEKKEVKQLKHDADHMHFEKYCRPHKPHHVNDFC
jgi:hypothetical protein